MELSPLARERLARIGALSEEERERLKQSEDLDSLLSEYFSGGLDTDGLWKRLKGLKQQRGESIPREAQARLVDTLRLRMDQEDFEQRRDAILAIETMKAEGKYSTLEVALDSIEAVRQEYLQVKQQAYEQLKAGLQSQLQAAAQQAKAQGMKIDMGGSLDANVRNSPQWKDFISQHEESSEEMFGSYIGRLRDAI
ncbi:MAG: hypothetical protein KAU10_03130 [Dehalococcoidia bacterium]|nr:hypothetical protein [Dehalococcoidia bacterium]